MALTVVNEESTCELDVVFKDADGVAAAPSSATWTAIDVDSGTVIQTATPITPIAASVTITIPSAVNAILDDGKDYEMRRIVVKALYSSTDGVNDQYDYLVENLSSVS